MTSLPCLVWDVFSLRVALACLQTHILAFKLGHFHTFPTFCCAYLHMFGVQVRCGWGQFRMTGGEWRPKPLPWNLVGNKTQMPGSILNFNLHKGSSSEQKSYWSHMVHISTAQAEGGFVEGLINIERSPSHFLFEAGPVFRKRKAKQISLYECLMSQRLRWEL